jgi:large subunit ribosomal protein L4
VPQYDVVIIVDLPKKIPKMALACTLSAKLAEGNLFILSPADLESHKTKNLVASLAANWDNSSALVYTGAVKQNLERASGNIPLMTVEPVKTINVYEILRRKLLFICQDAIPFVQARVLGKDYQPQSDTENPEATTTL